MLCAGDNTIQVSLPEVRANMDESSTYFMGVEVVTTLAHEAVRDLIQANEHISADETKREVQRRLNPGDSDDIIVANDHICVSVTDPFTCNLFKSPVRGVDCKHIDCFDLDIWLQTRNCKPSRDEGEPSEVDCWKCPICGSDARPVSLHVDDYFAEVQRELRRGGNLDVKHISITSDGSWKRIQEADETIEPYTSEQSPPRIARAPNMKSHTPDIITLDDDD